MSEASVNLQAARDRAADAKLFLEKIKSTPASLEGVIERHRLNLAAYYIGEAVTLLTEAEPQAPPPNIHQHIAKALEIAVKEGLLP